MAWPFEEHQSARPRRLSPLYPLLVEQGAVFGEKLGWERPNWFAPPGVDARDVYSYGRQNWFAQVGEEHRACRERVALFDQTSFAKYELQGPGAEAALQWLCANDVGKPPGAVTYTQMLNAKGGIECDLSVTRLSEDHFYIVTGTGFATHDLDWIARHLPEGCNATLEDVTANFTVLALMGPRSREVLATVTAEDVSDAAFPFARYREIHVAGCSLRAMRISYVGELGWELHVPVADARTVYAALMDAGKAAGIANAGYRAIESLRLEKGMRAWGSDIGPDHTPLEAGLGWAVKLRQNIPFLGREALLHQAASPLGKRLATFSVDNEDVVLLGRETLYRNGERVGWLASAGWGYTLRTNIGMGYVRHAGGLSEEWLRAGSYELEVASTRLPCRLGLPVAS